MGGCCIVREDKSSRAARCSRAGRRSAHAVAAGAGADAEPLKIGFLTVNTGPLAAGGKQQEEGAALFLKERGGMIAGRKVELITQDTAGNPSLARTKTQELVERYKVPVMIGPLATNEALAMDGYIRDSQGAAHHHDLGRDRRSESAPGQSVGAACVRHGAAGDVSARRLRGQDARL